MKKRMIATILSVVMAITLLSGCGSASGTSAEKETAGSEAAGAETAQDTKADGETVITIARPVDSATLDPIVAGLNEDIWMINLMLQGMTKASADGTEIQPCLAESWDISDDQLTYTFHIRDGLKFSDGSDVTAQDWQYSFDRYMDAEESPWRGMISMIDSINVPDDTTVEIKDRKSVV